MELYDMTAAQTVRFVAERKLSAVEAACAYLERIKREDKNVSAYITVCDEVAIAAAKGADERLSRGEELVLAGVPIAIKDNICTAGILTTCASNMLKGYVPPYNACVVDKLTNTGAVITGKVNLDEFAMGSFGDKSAFFQTKNPIGEEYAPGGSSSGGAAAVAASLAAASIGTDTGGSVRIPAAFCGLVGFKPTYGAISRFGLIAYASSLDTIGVITKTVEDVRLLSSVLFGRDVRDMTSCDVELCCTEIDLNEITFAFSDSDLIDTEKEICEATLRVSELLVRSGAKRVDKTVFGNSRMDEAYKIIACAEATSNLARYDGIKYGGEKGLPVSDAREKLFGTEVKHRIEYGNFVLSAENFEKYYKAATGERRSVMKKLDLIFAEADIILSPLCEFAVPKYSETENCRADRFTVAANFAGIPAISIPAGRDRRGMPVSVQLMSKKYSDAQLLSIAQKLSGLLREEAAI